MTASHPRRIPCQWFSWLAAVLDRRAAPRLAPLLLGAVLARGRRIVTRWIRAAKLGDQFPSCNTAVAAAGKETESIAARLVVAAVKPLLAGTGRLTPGVEDTPTKRYGPNVQGAGVHHNPTPGPAGSCYLREVLLRLSAGEMDLEALLPDRWAASHPEHVLEHRLGESRKAARQKEKRQRPRASS